MKTVKDMLASKERELWSVSPKETVFEALKLMSEKAIGALPVWTRNKGLVGILSERDYARKVILAGKTSRETLVEEIMTPASQMIVVQPETSLEECMILMTDHHIRHLPVLEGHRLVGIVSSRDVIQALIEGRARHIDNLHQISESVFTQSFDDDIAGGKG